VVELFLIFAVKIIELFGSTLSRQFIFVARLIEKFDSSGICSSSSGGVSSVPGFSKVTVVDASPKEAPNLKSSAVMPSSPTKPSN